MIESAAYALIRQESLMPLRQTVGLRGVPPGGCGGRSFMQVQVLTRLDAEEAEHPEGLCLRWKTAFSAAYQNRPPVMQAGWLVPKCVMTICHTWMFRARKAPAQESR